MDCLSISLDPLRAKTVAILGYGNQGAAHALNLRDAGIKVVVGSRPGKSFDRAVKDGFTPVSLHQAAQTADVVMFLLSDSAISSAFQELAQIVEKKVIGFAHGFAFHFKKIPSRTDGQYFLVGPKGAGAILREKVQHGSGLPGVFAVSPGATKETREVCMAYAKGIGVADQYLQETSFQEETECDLFGEQAVLCGGIMQLMESAFEVLVKNGHRPEMAFFECVYEARLILDLLLKYGPSEMANRISPTAFYGGLTRGGRLVTEETRKELENIFAEIRSGAFAKEWQAEVDGGFKKSDAEKMRLKESLLQRTFEKISAQTKL